MELSVPAAASSTERLKNKKIERRVAIHMHRAHGELMENEKEGCTLAVLSRFLA